MVKLNLPEFDVELKQEAEKDWIYDTLRKKYLVLTPEEWVRQHFINYLINHLHYPKSLFRIEHGLKVNKLSRRSDILVYDRQGKPHMLIECKAPQISLKQDVFDQLSNYNQTYQARYLVITNGIKHFCCQLDYQSKQYEFLKEVPVFI